MSKRICADYYADKRGKCKECFLSMPYFHLNLLREGLKKLSTKFYFFKNIWQKIAAEFFKIVQKKNNLNGQDELDQKLLTSLVKKRWPNFKQLKYLGEVLSPQEKKQIKILSFLVIVCLIGLAINFYFTGLKIVPKNGGTYTEGLVGVPKFINPLYSSLNQVDEDLARLVYASLVKIDKDQNMAPDLAKNWQVSADGKAYTFFLKENLIWHDGEALTADDVIFTFKAIKNPEFKSPLSQKFTDVEIEKIDDSTVKFTLKEPYTPFLENLTVGILPEHLWQEVAPGNMLLTDYNLKPIGAGPYLFKSLSKDKLGNIKSYTLVKNKKYHFREPYLDSLTFKFYPDYKTAVEALKNHNLDGLSYLPKELKEELSVRKDINYYALQLPQYTALFFNQGKNEALKDLKIRQALAYSLDKSEIIKEALQT